MICAGLITSLHGVRGCLRVLSYIEDNSVLSDSPVFIDGKQYSITSFFTKKRLIIIRLQGIDSADSASLLIQKEIFIKKSSLPDLKEDEYYFQDLIGLSVYSGLDFFGVVFAVHNFGASDILEITVQSSGKNVMIPFTEEFILDIDIIAGKIHTTAI